MLPQADQARKAIWEAINPLTGKRRIDEAFPHAMRETTRENEMFMKFVNGATWQVVGSDNYNSLVGSPPIGVVFSEWSLADPQAWAYMRPILLDNGGWAFFIFTPRGRNHAWKTLQTALKEPGWFGESLTVEDTGRFTPEQLASERRELIDLYGEEFGESAFQQEYYCSFDAAIVGAYYAKLLQTADKEKRVARVPYEPSLPVDTAWDLGIGDPTAIWFIQETPHETRWIDYYESSGAALDHYVKILREKPYAYRDHYLPHDAEVKELGTGRSRVETLKSLGVNNITIVPAQSVDDGINAMRMLLPRSWFDAEKCERGLNALRQYRAEFDDKHKTLKPRPVHDWASHGSDAARTYAMGRKPPAKKPQQTVKPKWVV